MATQGIHKIAVWSPDIRKTLLCVTAIEIVLRSHGALARDLSESSCFSTTTFDHATTSRRRTRAQCDHQWSKCDCTATLLRLRRPRYAAWALPLRLLRTHGVRTTILRRPSAFRCIYGYIPWLARMFWTPIFKWKCVVSYLEHELWFHSSFND